jgi:hypothetical protein
MNLGLLLIIRRLLIETTHRRPQENLLIIPLLMNGMEHIQVLGTMGTIETMRIDVRFCYSVACNSSIRYAAYWLLISAFVLKSKSTIFRVSYACRIVHYLVLHGCEKFEWRLCAFMKTLCGCGVIHNCSYNEVNEWYFCARHPLNRWREVWEVNKCKYVKNVNKIL